LTLVCTSSSSSSFSSSSPPPPPSSCSLTLHFFKFVLGFPHDICPFCSAQSSCSPSFTPIYLRSDSASSIHLILGLPFFLLPLGLPGFYISVLKSRGCRRFNIAFIQIPCFVELWVQPFVCVCGNHCNHIPVTRHEYESSKHFWLNLQLRAIYEFCSNTIRHKICALLGCYAAQIGSYLPTFRENLLVPSSRVFGLLLWAGRSGDRISVRARFSAPVHTGAGAHPASYTMGTGSLSRG
jgi:hypothetical protein